MDAQEAFEYMLRVERPSSTFDELGVIDPDKASLEAKLRSAITKHTIGAEAAKNPDLVSKLSAAREELKTRARPMQISGSQLVWVVRQYFRVDDEAGLRPRSS